MIVLKRTLIYMEKMFYSYGDSSVFMTPVDGYVGISGNVDL